MDPKCRPTLEILPLFTFPHNVTRCKTNTISFRNLVASLKCCAGFISKVIERNQNNMHRNRQGSTQQLFGRIVS